MTRRRSWLALAATLLVGILAQVGCSRDRRTASGSSSTSSARMSDMPGMSGMPGMSNDAREDSGKAAAVELSPTAQREFGITFGTVERRRLTDELRTIGTVTIDERRVAQLAPKFSGFAERLYVDAAGAPVRRGQPMIEIYSPDVFAAEQELLSTSILGRTLDVPSVPGVPVGSSDLLGAARQRLRFWDVPESEVDEVMRTGNARRTVTLVAPISGVVTEKNVVSGQSVAMGQPLYTISDLSDVWVIVEVREADAARLHAGSGAQVRLESMPGRRWMGRVAYVYPTLDAQNRAVRARIVIANRDGALKPGMFTTVRISSPMRDALTVPASSVVRTGQRALVFVDQGTG
ncbi:MAG TPA: efflux RND transporter periplasmic adaptor subunit, partial [Gemmatimonadaceae bacterium]|nr:efflux RND transporter periplasmic adaptor subunit [Gemmatimonadaceae bacterium]